MDLNSNKPVNLVMNSNFQSIMDLILQCLTLSCLLRRRTKYWNKALRNFSSFNWNRMSFKRFFYVIMTRQGGKKFFFQPEWWRACNQIFHEILRNLFNLLSHQIYLTRFSFLFPWESWLSAVNVEREKIFVYLWIEKMTCSPFGSNSWTPSKIKQIKLFSFIKIDKLSRFSISCNISEEEEVTSEVKKGSKNQFQWFKTLNIVLTMSFCLFI